MKLVQNCRYFYLFNLFLLVNFFDPESTDQLFGIVDSSTTGPLLNPDSLEVVEFS